MAEPPSFFTGRRGRGWQDPPPPPSSSSEVEEHGRPLSGTRSEMMATAGSAVGDDPSYPPPVAACYLVPPSPAGRRRPSFRAPAPFSPRSPAGSGGGGGGVGAGAARFFCDPRGEDEGRHFLDACAMCRKPLGANRDIFMYRGDVPFCSEECRQEQMDMDEARERGAMKASARNASSSSEQQQGIRVPAAGAIVAG